MRTALALVALLLCKTCLAQLPPPAMPKAINPPYDAERKVREYLKENCRDPNKLEFLAFSKPFDCEGCHTRGRDGKWGTHSGGTAIYVRYKTLNLDNQIETMTRVFIMGRDVPTFIYSESMSDFKTASKVDPFSKEFLKQ